MYRRTVMIVDDQKLNRDILGKLLGEEYELMYAADGQEALELIRANYSKLSAIILDIFMPVLDGYEVLKIMSADKQLSKIPVIVSSQDNTDETEIKALSLGSQDFIAKPYKAEIIKHRLSNIIKLRENAAVINRIEKDALTGLYNKEFFVEEARKLLMQNPDKEYDMLCIGVEHFKLVNDTYGLKKGDETLKHIADVIFEACGWNGICGRFGADNFYALREHTTEYTNERFRPWIEKIQKGSCAFDIKLHCGIYEITDRDIDITVMCDRAQLAAERNRGKYDDLFSMYDESLRQKLLDEQFITGSMQNALDNQEFTVYYQPKYDLNTEMIAGAEALVRWIHPVKGFISPGEFIPVFEKNGFITQLDIFVWETTCRNIHKWITMGFPPIAVSVNVSRADIYNPKLVDILLGLVAKYEISMRYLHLEITESAYTENPGQIIEVVGRLRKLGFVIEMDDFGSGYSSLNMLAEMPVDVLKLDIRFIQNEAKESSGRGILSFIISLAKWLNLAVVAEGVETAEQIAVLRSMDCTYVQGFYFARPMKEEDFRQLLNTSDITEMVCAQNKAFKYAYEKNPIMGPENGRVMLVVDDIDINRAAIAAMFMDEYVVVEKENGKTAWEYLEENYDKVDIVMLDLLMPVMDGFQTLSRIREDERTRKIPVIITSQGDRDSEKKALAMEADDFISKPYNADIIKHRVTNVTASRELETLKLRLANENN